MERLRYLDKIKLLLRIHPLCGILGPRQVGKTTLAREYAKKYFPNDAEYFDLENQQDLARLENPLTVLSSINQRLIVVDEIQRRPELFPTLRVLVDNTEKKYTFLILGSASGELLRQCSETLAGRIGYMELPPFSLFEVKNSDNLWLRGGFPRSYLADTDEESYLWRENYINTFLTNDIANLGFNIPAASMYRFWLMLVYYHGQIFNASEIGKSLGLSDHTVRKYLDILAGTFMIRILLPWFENIKKRQIKSPKIYFRDSGILNSLLSLRDLRQLQIHPRLGSFWEGFALEEIIRIFGLNADECFFWGTHSDGELDLFFFKNGKRLGFEFKYSDVPKITKSMHIAIDSLNLDHLGIVYPGSHIFALEEKISAYGLDSLATGEFMRSMNDDLGIKL